MHDLILTNATNTGFMASASLTKVEDQTIFKEQQHISQYGLIPDNSSLYTYDVFISDNLESNYVIQRYFKSLPEERKRLRESVANSIRGIGSVFEILSWSIKTDVRDAYDAAVDLLAQSSNITLKVAIHPALEHLISDKKVATLISGIVRAKHIPIQQRLKVILQYLKSDKRVIKESVIDVLLLLADEAKENRVDSDILEIAKFYLKQFASDTQPDKFIRGYARDIIDEI